ncbi:MAG: DNA (cytosine-5-)-methyltransferase [Thiotrichaceae bacterium IS1]|nr:MAG: DNA (cytosine-5-)-methyltransferase [Thiotrichaceae bacterium IS1]
MSNYNYIKRINDSLIPQVHLNWTVLDLFAGSGGLSLGFEVVGFPTTGYEKDSHAVETYNRNLKGRCFEQTLTSGTKFEIPYEVIIGGPPCQPFSVGGHQKGKKDERNGFPIFINAVRQLKPQLWLFENVRGMLYSNKEYFAEILRELTAEGYLIEYQLLNAVNYGVPQNRERLFVVGHRSKFTFPPPEVNRVTVGDAIGDLIEIIQDDRKILTPSMDRYVANYERASQCLRPRDLYLDKPARTLTCRNIAAPTGDMQRVRLQEGKRRRLVVREAARLQSFPDWFEFCGTETQQYYQIGNAVPPLLAYHLATAVRNYLAREHRSESETIKKLIQPRPPHSLFTSMVKIF